MEKRSCVIILCVLISGGIKAQDTFDEFKKRMEKNYAAFRNSRDKEFEDFRNKINKEYAELVKKAWKEFNAVKGIPVPDEDKPVPPVIYPDKDKNKPVKDNPKPFDEVVPVVDPEPRPEPVVPIETTPEPADVYFTFNFFNTGLKVRLDDRLRFRLHKPDESRIATVWNDLSQAGCDKVIYDCLAIRSQKKLCDWAYLLMLRDLSVAFFKGHSNEAVLFTAFLYCQSGYKMRLAYSGDRLFLLFASKHTIYGKNYWPIDGDKFYPLDCDLKQLYVCQAAFPQEKPLSLQIPSDQSFALQASAQRVLTSKRYPETEAAVCTNENLIRFFDTYPTSMINNDFGTRWAMYANTPLSEQAQRTLYPALTRAINGKSRLDAVNRLLNFVQTAFKYEFDDKVWGGDRAFFADETLYYPYCDCEDRSILFSRLVRDLLGADVILVYYPGHLAAAVHFIENVTGDYFLVNGKRYVICDPTYIGAPVGATMPKMDNAKAKVILLN